MELIVVAIIIGALVVGALLVVRWSRAQAADAADARVQLAQRMGLVAENDGKRMTGTCQGRACSISEGSTIGTGGSNWFIRISAETTATLSLELHPQSSSLGAKLSGDVEIGDAEFDKWFIVRTTDLSTVTRALSADLRRQFVDWVRSGRLLRVYIKDGRLHAEGGRGLRRRPDVETAGTMLEAVARLARALE